MSACVRNSCSAMSWQEKCLRLKAQAKGSMGRRVEIKAMAYVFARPLGINRRATEKSGPLTLGLMRRRWDEESGERPLTPTLSPADAGARGPEDSVFRGARGPEDSGFRGAKGTEESGFCGARGPEDSPTYEIRLGFRRSWFGTGRGGDGTRVARAQVVLQAEDSPPSTVSLAFRADEATFVWIVP
jgi:hypothetical protein